MSLMDQLRSLVDDPAPYYAFEVSPEGIATAKRARGRGQAPDLSFRPFESEVIRVSPVRDNVVDQEAFAREAARAMPPNGTRGPREAALILPDYAARVAVLDFDSFPGVREEQLALVRFRLKKTVPFDVDTATVNFQVQRTHEKRHEVVVAAASQEIIARYEAPFRVAGFVTGFTTTSMLAAVDLLPAAGLTAAVKRSGTLLTVAVCDGRHPKMIRSVELETGSPDEALGILIPTFAYAEDELKQRPARILACGFGDDGPEFAGRCAEELGAVVEPLRSAWGPAQHTNAGLLGWLEAQS